jgi:hypothetical protein
MDSWEYGSSGPQITSGTSPDPRSLVRLLFETLRKPPLYRRPTLQGTSGSRRGFSCSATKAATGGPHDERASLSERYDELEYDYRSVVSVTGATLSTDAIVEGVRGAVARVAGEAFDVRIPLPSKPFEFGFLEITVLALFAVGLAGHRLRGPARRRLRWAAQITVLVVLGFWKDSPITLSKIAAFLSGFFPDPRTSLALYLLLAGFLLTSVLYGRNLYCLYACPFGAAQRVVGAIGGFRLKVPPGAARFLVSIRNAVVFAALFLAFLTLQPVLSGYEPFAALFSLHGTTLQWFLLFLVLVASLFLTEPWCTFLCPMGALEKVVREGKRWAGGKGGVVVAGAGDSAVAVADPMAATHRPGPQGRRGWPTFAAILLGLVAFGVTRGVLARNLTQGS